MIHYCIMSILAVLFGQLVGHLNKKMPPVVAEEITYKEFYNTLFKDFKVDFVYSIVFFILFNCMIYFIGPSFNVYLYSLISIALAITFSIDFRFQLIPDEVHIFLLVIGVIKLIVNFSFRSLISVVLGTVAGGGIFLLVGFLSLIIFKKEGMGFGDVKLMAALGFVFGLKSIIVITLVSFIFGAIIGGIILIIKSKESDGYIPFGPFIVIATVILYFIPSDTIINLYIAFCTWLGDVIMSGMYSLISK